MAVAQAEDPEAGEADGADAEAEPRGALMKLLPELRARLDAIDSDVRQIETAGDEGPRRPTRAAAAAAAASADEPEWLKSAAERLSVSPSPVPPPPQEEEDAAKAPAAIVARHVEPLEEVTKAVAQITTSVSSRRGGTRWVEWEATLRRALVLQVDVERLWREVHQQDGAETWN